MVRLPEWRTPPGATYDRRVLARTTIGLGTAAGGLTLLTYGIAQAIENGSCGVDEYGTVLGAPCPDGFGPMILLMILGSMVALVGAALASSLARFILPAIVAVGAGVVLGFLDVHENDSRPGLEIIAAVAAPMVLFTVPFVGRRSEPRTFGLTQSQMHQVVRTFTPVTTPAATEPTFTAPAPQWQPRTTQDAEEIAGRLRQLDQLKASGLLDDAAYDAQRKRILAEL
jgi:hypothetical protein